MKIATILLLTSALSGSNAQVSSICIYDESAVGSTDAENVILESNVGGGS